MSTFYVIATPIGNLEDITLRAISTLKSVDVILCEDTRVTSKLLQRIEVSEKSLMSFHAQSPLTKIDEIASLLREGKNVGFVTDAGTPGISDPGSLLVSKLRETFTAEELSIVCIPGASALTAALSIAGVPVSEFVFLGFLPHKKGRETLFKEIAASERTMVFYESPHRIEKTLESLVLHLGDGKRVTVCRELTKIFEEVVAGSATVVKEYFSSHQDKVRGEFVVIVS